MGTMYLLIVVLLAASGTVHGDLVARATPAATPPAALAATPAALFWKDALPDSPLPKAIMAAIGRGGQRPPLTSQAAWPKNCFGSYRGGDECFRSHRGGDITVSHQAACLGSYWGGGGNGCSEMVATTGLFFNEAAVQVGKVMTLSFPPAPEIAILPRKVAERIPFENISSSSNLTDNVLKLFHIGSG